MSTWPSRPSTRARGPCWSRSPCAGRTSGGRRSCTRWPASAASTVFVGYDHVVGAAALTALEKARGLGQIETLDVEFREHWGGIFAAHAWLDGPQDSYLGFWKRGGGASGEHSHAINLWQHFARELGSGRVVEVTASLDYVQDGRVDYDKLCLLNLEARSRASSGRVVQDVVTSPPRKWARIQGDAGHVERRHRLSSPAADRVSVAARATPTPSRPRLKRRDRTISSRSSDTSNRCSRGASDSGILKLDRGLDTMLVVAAAHLLGGRGAANSDRSRSGLHDRRAAGTRLAFMQHSFGVRTEFVLSARESAFERG